MQHLRVRHWVFILGWAALCAGGLLALASYEGRPATIASRPTHWPASTTLAPNASGATVLMFLHPRCPCSRASLEQFLATLRRSQTTATLVVFEPLTAPDNWYGGDLYDLALEHPEHLQIVPDPGGAEAARFGATASGTCLIFDEQQQLTFHGGVTISRGHRGPNAGWKALEVQLQRPSTPTVVYPVFGCSLTSTSSPTDLP